MVVLPVCRIFGLGGMAREERSRVFIFLSVSEKIGGLCRRARFNRVRAIMTGVGSMLPFLSFLSVQAHFLSLYKRLPLILLKLLLVLVPIFRHPKYC